VAGFCKVATIEEVAKLNYVLTPADTLVWLMKMMILIL
jgi:hypothetical protein